MCIRDSAVAVPIVLRGARSSWGARAATVMGTVAGIVLLANVSVIDRIYDLGDPVLTSFANRLEDATLLGDELRNSMAQSFLQDITRTPQAVGTGTPPY